MTRNHSLRPDGDAEKFNWFVRMEEHPDCQPRRAIAMNGGNDDDANGDQDFERKRIDKLPQLQD